MLVKIIALFGGVGFLTGCLLSVTGMFLLSLAGVAILAYFIYDSMIRHSAGRADFFSLPFAIFPTLSIGNTILFFLFVFGPFFIGAWIAELLIYFNIIPPIFAPVTDMVFH